MAKALLVGLLLYGALSLGCGKSNSASSRMDLDGTGLDKCDEYIAKMAACAGKLPAEIRPAHEAAITTARDILEQQADAAGASAEGDPKAHRLALTTACKQMAGALSERAICN